MFYRFLLIVCLTASASAFATAQIAYSSDNVAIFDGAGSPATLEQIIEAASTMDVLFLGEQHDDAVAHAAQLEMLTRLYKWFGAGRRIVLSLEMFERDTQIVVDEYLAGLIGETHFMTSARAWPNYKSDYKPLVEFAKEKKLRVIAANAPRRYVNMVSRGGRASINKLSCEAKAWLAPLPFAEPSAAYAAKFRALMGGASEAQLGLENILASQSLWDATMADSIARALRGRGKPLVIHLNGSFHSESRLGTVEHLQKYRRNAKTLVVTMKYEKEFKSFDKTKHAAIGDFVILTDAAVPRSRR
jgi:uncharacterized iron-regulated protein